MQSMSIELDQNHVRENINMLTYNEVKIQNFSSKKWPGTWLATYISYVAIYYLIFYHYRKCLGLGFWSFFLPYWQDSTIVSLLFDITLLFSCSIKEFLKKNWFLCKIFMSWSFQNMAKYDKYVFIKKVMWQMLFL